MVRMNPECKACGRPFLRGEILNHITIHHKIPLDWVWFVETNGESAYCVISPERAKNRGLVG